MIVFIAAIKRTASGWIDSPKQGSRHAMSKYWEPNLYRMIQKLPTCVQTKDESKEIEKRVDKTGKIC